MATGGKLNEWFKNNVSWMDLFVPGSTALINGISKTSNDLFDLNGATAAQNQFQNQLELQHDAQNYNASQAQAQREWEMMMSSTAYQRQVADMEAAGLNPYALMSGGGYAGGASTPSGASAQTSAGSADMANNKLTAAAGVVALFLKLMLK